MLRDEDWMRQARADRVTATIVCENARWDWACFACQQSAEKFLKSALEAKRADYEGHSLPTLLRRFDAEAPDEVAHACRVLNRYYIRTRHPDAHDEGAPVELYDEKDARDALEQLRLVAEYVELTRRPSEA